MSQLSTQKEVAPEPFDVAKFVGPEVYSTWVVMLATLGPNGRTHRLAVVVAAMLQFLFKKIYLSGEARTISPALISVYESGNPDGIERVLQPIVEKIFRDARIPWLRQDSTGRPYSIAEAHALLIAARNS